jgi:iron complex outermembrane receptor protein
MLILMMDSADMPGQEVNLPDTLTIVLPEDTLVSELNEVVITGTRVQRRIIDIPYPVLRVNMSNHQFDRRIGADDILSGVPGMFLQSRYGNHDVRFSIRGFGSRSNSGIRGVRILLDDIPESEPDGQTRVEAIDFNAIGRIEVVKGNASSMYTNAPGGVANFLNDIDFQHSFVSLLNQFGSFGLQRNGIKAGVRTDNYGLLTTYSRQQYNGYRAHNNEQWDILNIVLETRPSIHTKLTLLGYFVHGFIQLPGSLTKEEFEANPYQADQRFIDRDARRASTKGRLGIRYNATFGKKLNNTIEVTSYGTIKYFERTSREFRIINRYGLGLTTIYSNTAKLGKRTNEFTTGFDLLYQPARTEYYDNIGGEKGDQLNQLTDEKISNTGFFISDNFEIVPKKLFVLLTGRFDRVVFDLSEETLPSRTDNRTFQAFTPKMAFNYKIKPWLSAYTSIGLSFDSPAKNELESIDPAYLYNSELEAQESRNIEFGIKGSLNKPNQNWFRQILFEATYFDILLKNEIVPFEVLGEVYFRNAARTNRRGLEMGTRMELYRNLNFTFSYTYSHFTYDSYIAKTIVIDSTGNIVERTQDFSGNTAPSVPVNNLFLALSYSWPMGKKLKGFAKASNAYISGLWVDDANSDQTDAYNLLNALIGLDMQFGGFNVQLSGGVNNMLDLVYVGFTNTNSADLRFYEAGAPRNYFITVNLGYTFQKRKK